MYFCTNGQKPLYGQLQSHPYVSYCTNADEFEPVLSINGTVVFVDDDALKLRAFQGSANVRRFYQTVDNPDFKLFYIGGFPKTSDFGKATLDLWEKAGFRPLFQEHFTKLTEFWEMLIDIDEIETFDSEGVRLYRLGTGN